MSNLNLSLYPTTDFDYRFQHPCSIYLSGASNSGKSSTLYKLLISGTKSFTVQFKKIFIVYGVHQAIFDELKNLLPIVLIPLENFELQSLLKEEDLEHSFVVFDDSFVQLSDNRDFSDIVTKYSHHKGFSVAIVSQYVFGSGKYSRIIATNSTYTLLFDSCRDRLSISILGRQMYPGNTAYFLEAFKHSTRTPFSCLLIDCHQACPSAFRLRSNILGSYPIVYLPPV